MAKTRQKWCWATRDKERDSFVRLWYSKIRPSMASERYWVSYTVSNSVLICLEVFRRLTGLNVKPGECLQVQFAATVIKEEMEDAKTR